MAKALIEGPYRTGIDRFVWTGGAGGSRVGPDTKLLETDTFPADLKFRWQTSRSRSWTNSKPPTRFTPDSASATDVFTKNTRLFGAALVLQHIIDCVTLRAAHRNLR